jgi:hypothetical protein
MLFIDVAFLSVEYLCIGWLRVAAHDTTEGASECPAGKALERYRLHFVFE